MTKKNYEAAARLIQDERREQNDDCEPLMAIFVDFFYEDNSRFDEGRFRRACVPGANVKARS